MRRKQVAWVNVTCDAIDRNYFIWERKYFVTENVEVDVHRDHQLNDDTVFHIKYKCVTCVNADAHNVWMSCKEVLIFYKLIKDERLYLKICFFSSLLMLMLIASLNLWKKVLLSLGRFNFIPSLINGLFTILHISASSERFYSACCLAGELLPGLCWKGILTLYVQHFFTVHNVLFRWNISLSTKHNAIIAHWQRKKKVR